MMPTMNLNCAADVLSAPSELKAAEFEEFIYNDYQHCNKQWSNHPKAPYTKSFAEGVISAKYSQSEFYETHRIGKFEFQVVFNEIFDNLHNEQDMSNKDVDDLMIIKISLFRHVHTVIGDDTGIMICTCSEYDCTGIFCVHQICVAQFIHNFAGLDFPGFDHHDIALRHTSACLLLANRIKTPNLLHNFFDRILEQEKAGPTLKIKIPSEMPFEESLPILPAHPEQ